MSRKLKGVSAQGGQVQHPGSPEAETECTCCQRLVFNRKYGRRSNCQSSKLNEVFIGSRFVVCTPVSLWQRSPVTCIDPTPFSVQSITAAELRLSTGIRARAPRCWPFRNQSGRFWKAGRGPEAGRWMRRRASDPHVARTVSIFGADLRLEQVADSSATPAVVRPALRGVRCQQRNATQMQLQPFLLTSSISLAWSQHAYIWQARWQPPMSNVACGPAVERPVAGAEIAGCHPKPLASFSIASSCSWPLPYGTQFETARLGQGIQRGAQMDEKSGGKRQPARPCLLYAVFLLHAI